MSFNKNKLKNIRFQPLIFFKVLNNLEKKYNEYFFSYFVIDYALSTYLAIELVVFFTQFVDNTLHTC